MPRLIAALVASLIALVVLAGGVLAVDDQAAGSAEGTLGTVHVDTATVRFVDDRPGPAELVITGSLPSACHEPAWEVESGPAGVRVRLWSWRDGADPCATVSKPVELTVPLGRIDTATSVRLEGEPVTWSVSTSREAVQGLIGAGWSFGMCHGYCAADLELTDDRVVLTGRDRDRTEPVFVNEGTLTSRGRSRLSAAAEALDGGALESVYGCPDCDDRGAAYLQFERASGETRHEMEFRAPPRPLAGLHALVMALSGALESCSSNELVTVAHDCVAYERSSA